MSLADAIGSLGAVPYTVKRFGPESIANGILVAGAQSSITIQGVVLPLKPEEADLLPEGISAQGTFKLFTKDLIRTADERNRTAGDRLVMNGRDYEVKDIENWGVYFKALVTEVSS